MSCGRAYRALSLTGAVAVEWYYLLAAYSIPSMGLLVGPFLLAGTSCRRKRKLKKGGPELTPRLVQELRPNKRSFSLNYPP